MGLVDVYLDGFKCIFEIKYFVIFEYIIYIFWILVFLCESCDFKMFIGFIIFLKWWKNRFFRIF